MDEFWQGLLTKLERQVSRPNFVTWLQPTRLIDNRGGLMVISVPNHYAKEWLEKHLLKEIKAALKEEFADFEAIQFEIAAKAAKKSIDDLPLLQNQTEAEAEVEEIEAPFNQKYGFDNFIVGNNNRLAFAAAQVVAEKPGEAYNPLFIYGGVGLGKTHLMHAIGNEVRRRNPKKKIIYTSCETFTSEFIQALQNKNINEFKKKYRTVDVFLVDDIQFLANKEGTQEEFFHTFNMLHQSNRQIVVTADRVPKEITDLEDRLVSRFGWGMVADIQAPNFENRVAILQAKALERGAEISTEVLDYVASVITNNVRELEGSLIKLITVAEVERQPITKEFAVQALKDLVNPVSGDLTTRVVIKKVADYFGVEVGDILGKKRLQELVHPRQIVMYLLREKLDLSYPQIGEALGGKDHTTIMHGVAKIERNIKTNPTLEADLKALTRELA